MSSEQRSSSAVRNLRSMFENKSSLDSNSTDSRGRSPSGLGSDREDGARPTSKVRASFVPVIPAASVASAMEGAQNGLSNGSGSKSAAGDAGEAVGLGSNAAHAEPISTPLSKLQETAKSEQKEDKPPANPDKAVTAAEEEPAVMNPAEPTNEQAVSGGEALLPVAEDLRSAVPAATSSGAGGAEKKAATNGKPAAISTKPASKPASSSVKSPTTPQASKDLSAPRAMTKKPSRSSLTAPTAASLARSGANDKAATASTSPASAIKKREVTKPVNISSHLTAPTASSRAKTEAGPDANATASSFRSSTTSRPKQTSTTKTSLRASLGAPAQRPTSQTSQGSAPRRSLAPADSSFLERMMKPTAASKAHERNEVKSPPKTKSQASKPKVNGTASKAASSSKAAPAEPIAAAADAEQESHADAQGAEESLETAHAEIAEPTTVADTPLDLSTAADETTKEERPGNATPIPTSEAPTDAALEATPAGIVSEETIR